MHRERDTDFEKQCAKEDEQNGDDTRQSIGGREQVAGVVKPVVPIVRDLIRQIRVRIPRTWGARAMRADSYRGRSAEPLFF